LKPGRLYPFSFSNDGAEFEKKIVFPFGHNMRSEMQMKNSIDNSIKNLNL